MKESFYFNRVMRIIGGIHRSRRIAAPKDAQTTRPITDRVKQSLFDRLWSIGVLGDHTPPDTPDTPNAATVLDIFSGTGTLGLEALSRRAAHCTFVESDRSARRLLKENISLLGLTEQSVILPVDALGSGWVHLLAEKMSLIFCDPPYRMLEEAAQRQGIFDLIRQLCPATRSGAVLVLRTRRATQVDPVEGWQSPQSHLIGSMALHFYERHEGA